MNTKILVNFESRKIIHTTAHAGATEFKKLIESGYEPVGVIKVEDPKIYWKDEFFDPQAKYIKPVKGSP